MTLYPGRLLRRSWHFSMRYLPSVAFGFLIVNFLTGIGVLVYRVTMGLPVTRLGMQADAVLVDFFTGLVVALTGWVTFSGYHRQRELDADKEYVAAANRHFREAVVRLGFEDSQARLRTGGTLGATAAFGIIEGAEMVLSGRGIARNITGSNHKTIWKAEENFWRRQLAVRLARLSPIDLGASTNHADGREIIEGLIILARLVVAGPQTTHAGSAAVSEEEIQAWGQNGLLNIHSLMLEKRKNGEYPDLFEQRSPREWAQAKPDEANGPDGA